MSAKVWFVTGASRGIGLELVKQLLGRHHKVVATARRVGDITANLAGVTYAAGDLLTVPLDVTKAADIEQSVATAIATFGRIDVLVNNAGHGQLGFFETVSEPRLRQQFEVNVFGTMNVTRAVLPHMRRQKSGLVMTLSSVAGLSTFPGVGIYSASKFALEGWMEALRGELQPLGIRCSLIEPGPFRTDFLDPSSLQGPDLAIDDYRDALAASLSAFTASNHKQVGCPVRLVQAMLQLTEREDGAIPFRFLAGSIAMDRVRTKFDSVTSEMSTYAALSTGTDDPLTA